MNCFQVLIGDIATKLNCELSWNPEFPQRENRLHFCDAIFLKEENLICHRNDTRWCYLSLNVRLWNSAISSGIEELFRATLGNIEIRRQEPRTIKPRQENRILTDPLVKQNSGQCLRPFLTKNIRNSEHTSGMYVYREIREIVLIGMYLYIL